MKDPYVYEGTNILINKLGIKDGKTLDKFESDTASLAIIDLKKSGFKITSIFDCLKIHKHLFERIYDWAGKPRTIDIYKAEPLLAGSSIDYVFGFYINQALSELQEEYRNVNWSELNSKEKIEKICYFVSEFWHIHPFREGNGRAQREFIRYIAGINGYGLDFSKVSENENIIASHESINGNNTKLEIVISNIIFELDTEQINKMNDVFKV